MREALEAQFPNLTFILDRPHLKGHLYEGAEAIGLTGLERHKWVSDKLHLIDSGGVRQVIRTLKGYRGSGKERVTQFISRISNDSEMLSIMTNSVLWVYRKVAGKVESAHRAYSPEAAQDSRGYSSRRKCPTVNRY